MKSYIYRTNKRALCYTPSCLNWNKSIWSNQNDWAFILKDGWNSNEALPYPYQNHHYVGLLDIHPYHQTLVYLPQSEVILFNEKEEAIQATTKNFSLQQNQNEQITLIYHQEVWIQKGWQFDGFLLSCRHNILWEIKECPQILDVIISKVDSYFFVDEAYPTCKPTL